jgi:HSP20 family protein
VANVESNTRDQTSRDTDSSNKKNFSLNLGGILGGLGGLVDKLAELAEAGEKLSQSGEFQDAAGKFHGVYGIHVKTALGDQGQQEIKVEPFGNVRRRASEGPTGKDVREPLVDIHEEEDHILVVIELPGVAKEDVTLQLDGNCLKLSAKRGEVGYSKDVSLPASFSSEQMQWDCKNGILQVHLKR